MESDAPNGLVDDEDGGDQADSFEEWEETEDRGDEREPFDLDNEGSPDSEVERVASEEDQEEEEHEEPPVPRRAPVTPEYPDPPCYVTVAQGDCVLSLARRFGRLPQQIWEAPENAELRQARAHNVLLPGDRAFIPALRIKTIPAATEQRHVYQAHGATCVLRMQLLREQQPRANLQYALTVPGKVHRGVTDGDGDGILEVTIRADAQGGILHLEDPAGEEVYPLRLGHLNPLDDVTGVQARLNNLDFACGAVDGQTGPLTQAALAAFQHAHGLQVTGHIDDATRHKLLERHGS